MFKRGFFLIVESMESKDLRMGFVLNETTKKQNKNPT